MTGDHMGEEKRSYNRRYTNEDVCKCHSGLMERVYTLETDNKEIKDSVDTIKSRLTSTLISLIVGIVLLLANLVVLVNGGSYG